MNTTIKQNIIDSLKSEMLGMTIPDIPFWALETLFFCYDGKNQPTNIIEDAEILPQIMKYAYANDKRVRDLHENKTAFNQFLDSYVKPWSLSERIALIHLVKKLSSRLAGSPIQ